jgi:hypothetical protein
MKTMLTFVSIARIRTNNVAGSDVLPSRSAPIVR